MNRLGLLHPSKQRLRHWLFTGEPAGVGQHLDTCERCAARLEELDAHEPVLSLDGPSPLRQALTSALSPPADLDDRVLGRVAARTGVDPEMTLLAGLLSIGVETAQLMIGPEVGRDPGWPARSGQTGQDGVEEDES